jgi:hypothetical protein
MMYLIILPQALKLVIPGIVNTFIGLFKDTTLVLIIGLFDLLGQIQSSFTDPTWSTPDPGSYRLPLCSDHLLRLLLRHVAIFHLYGEEAAHRTQTITLFRGARDEIAAPRSKDTLGVNQ